ncbi:unnamed protein product [Mycena citricolor]|uniref:Zn(2)-C6 fungal-type domain-containing protein n=1 Tax=Mycena citricolor TaxID=2018698 RepID=A0AAD2HEX3_9AGAR|nr:unnamed protein product [Mycena citricolor]
MDSVIELQRQTHEEIERFERALSSLLSRNTPAHEQRIQQETRAAQILDRITGRAVALDALYEDEERRRAEIDRLTAPNQQDDFTEFYARLVKIQEHHAKYPDSVPGGFDLELATLLEEPNQDGADEEYEEEDPISLLFSGEESYGKYVDLYANHVAFTNLKNVGKRPGYLQYLDLLLLAQYGPIHRDLSKETRFSKDFETYIKNLHTYLLSFSKRTMPLVDMESQQLDATKLFEEKWAAGEIRGWEENAPKATVNGQETAGIWCPACQKLYAKQTVFDAHLTSKKHVKTQAKIDAGELTPAPRPTENGTSAVSSSTTQSSTQARLRNTALWTWLSTSLLVPLIPVLNDTKSNVERRFSLTAREREQELIEQAKPVAPPTSSTKEGAEEEEEEERIYNPLKLPLGWDGKPIPYWLYKLHGLGVEYRCEICSDAVYKGRKNFERHFQESRHAFGMRALGLPNTKHFHEITRIEDARSLAEKLSKDNRRDMHQQDTMEELEDEDGNVYDRKTYEDLKKQGIIYTTCLNLQEHAKPAAHAKWCVHFVPKRHPIEPAQRQSPSGVTAWTRAGLVRDRAATSPACMRLENPGGLTKGAACISCRQKKKKCNGKTPCSGCVRLGMSESCHYGGKVWERRAARKEKSSPISTEMNTESQSAAGPSNIVSIPNISSADSPPPEEETSSPLASPSETLPDQGGQLDSFALRCLFLQHCWHYGFNISADKRAAIADGDTSGAVVHPVFIVLCALMGYMVATDPVSSSDGRITRQTAIEKRYKLHILDILAGSVRAPDPMTYVQVYQLLGVYHAKNAEYNKSQEFLGKASNVVMQNQHALRLNADNLAISFGGGGPPSPHVLDVPSGLAAEARSALSHMVPSQGAAGGVGLWQVILRCKSPHTELRSTAADNAVASEWSAHCKVLVADVEKHIAAISQLDVSTEQRLLSLALKGCIIISLAALAEVYSVTAPFDALVLKKHRSAIADVADIARTFRPGDHLYFNCSLECAWNITSCIVEEQEPTEKWSRYVAAIEENGSII